jgi:hypothetical protein
MKTPEEFNQEINIANLELAYANNSDEKVKLQNKISKLKLEREISIIKKKIEQLH